MKQNNLCLITLMLFIGILQNSFAQGAYYAPKSLTNIDLREKGDFNINLSSVPIKNFRNSINAKDKAKDLDLTLALSPIKHVGIYYNRHSYNDRFTREFYDPDAFNPLSILVLLTTLGEHGVPSGKNITVNIPYNYRVNELGLGFYKSFNNLNIELYGFRGKGSVKMYEGTRNALLADVSKLGLRTGFSYQLGRFEFGLGMSNSRLNFQNIESSLSSRVSDIPTHLRSNAENSLFEYSLNIQFQVIDGLKLKLEAGESSSNNSDFELKDGFVSVGMNIGLTRMARKIKQRKKSNEN